VEDDNWRGSHLFGLRMPPGLDLSRLHEALERRRIFVSLRGSALRVSPNVYNDQEDLDALVRVLTDVVSA
jgi:selenocysteine lyase/cysteine desulfurase